MAETSQSFIFTVPALLLALAAAVGLVSHQTRLSTPRPDSEDTSDRLGSSNRGVQARLWEDPLGVIESATRQKANSAPTFTITADAEGLKVHGSDSSTVQPMGISALAKTLREKIQADDTAEPTQRATGMHGVEVLIVTVRGGAYAEDVESRLRARHALASALSTAGYKPETGNHINALKVDWTSLPKDPWEASGGFREKGPNDGESALSVNIAFEWWEARLFEPRQRREKNHVLVLWTPESGLAARPLARLAMLIKRLRPREGIGYASDFHATILGPYSSSLLREMLPWQSRPAEPKGIPKSQMGVGIPELAENLRKAAEQNLKNRQKLLSDVTMYSWSASIMDDLLVQRFQSHPTRRQVSDWLEATWGLNFVNTVATDDQLSAELIDELQLRGVNVNDETHHIVLISEWDTLDGRMFPLAFAEEALRKHYQASDGARNATVDREALEQTSLLRLIRRTPPMARDDFVFTNSLPNFHAFTYLRGIDGKAPQVAHGSSDASKAAVPDAKSSENQVNENAREMDRAEGANQLDYIPRLADQLEALQAQFRKDERRNLASIEEIKAIGVVGSDFYDKEMILQALRDRFPRAVFFTTGFDARFLDPKFEPYTRNVVVASPFGLSLHPRFQRGIPPFRDTRQTSLYFATLAAMGMLEPAEGAPIAPPPRRFEIGRFNAIDLSIDPPHDNKFFDFHPPRSRSLPSLPSLLWGTIALVAVGWFVLRYSKKFHRAINGAETSRRMRESLLYSPDDIWDESAILTWLRTSMNTWTPAGVEHPPWLRTCVDCRAATSSGQNAAAGLNWLLINGRMPYGMLRASAERLDRMVGRASWATELNWARVLEKFTRDHRHVHRWAKWIEQRALDWRSLRNLASNRLWLDKLLWATIDGERVALVTPGEARARRLHGSLRGALWALAFTALAVAVFVFVVVQDHHSPDGEPFSLLQGTSVWPSTALRLIALISSVLLIFKANADLRAMGFEVAERFALPLVDADESVTRLRAVNRTRWICFLLHRSLKDILSWSPGYIGATNWVELKRCKGPALNAGNLWKTYRRLGATWLRLSRVAKSWVCYFVFWQTLVYTWGYRPFLPFRGAASRDGDFWVTVCAFGAFAALTFYVVDATRLCKRFVYNLGVRPIQWPQATLNRFSEELGGAAFSDLSEWINTQLIAAATKIVAPLVYYPFFVLSLLIVSRSTYFDSYDWPFYLLILYATNVFWCVYSAILLQAAGKSAREKALHGARIRLAKAQNAAAIEAPGDPEANAEAARRAEHLKRIIDDIETIRDGAFTTYLEVPWVRAILLPLSGSGALAVVEFLTRR